MTARHSNDLRLSVVASLYPGETYGGSARVIRTATLEPSLEQIGQEEPEVRVSFRRFRGREQEFIHDFLRLTVTDAQELATALMYLVDTADKG